MKEIAQKITNRILLIYFFSLPFSAIYFNWKYVNEHGLKKWIFPGGIVATSKSLAWPYYALKISKDDNVAVPTTSDPRTIPHFWKSIAAVQKALSERDSITPGTIAQDSQEKFNKMKHYYKEALFYAEKVDPRDLESSHHETPERFTNDYLAGLRLICVGLDESNARKMNEGSALVSKWGAWYRLRRNEQ